MFLWQFKYNLQQYLELFLTYAIYLKLIVSFHNCFTHDSTSSKGEKSQILGLQYVNNVIIE